MAKRDVRFDSETFSQHVGLKGHSSNNVFLDDFDRAHFLKAMGMACEEYDVKMLVYALMDNHIHMILHGEIEQFKFVFESVGASYAREFNKKLGGSGAVWTQRYYNGPIQTAEQFLKTAAYIFNNPVEAGLCASAKDSDWTNYQDLAEGEGGEARKIIDELVNVEELLEYTLCASEHKLTNREAIELGITENKRVADADLCVICSKIATPKALRRAYKLDVETQNCMVKEMWDVGGNVSQIARITGITKYQVKKFVDSL